MLLSSCLPEPEQKSHQKTADTVSQLFNAVDARDEKRLVDVLNKGLDPDSLNRHGDTALIWCTFNHEPALVNQLLRAGADPNLPGSLGRAPLHWSARAGDRGISRLLLNAGADPDLRDNAGYTPLMFAARAGDHESVQFMLEKGADPNLTADNGYTPLMLALHNRAGSAVASLIEAGTELNRTGSDGLNALEIALQRGSDRYLRAPEVIALVPNMKERLARHTRTVVVNADNQPTLDWNLLSQTIHRLINVERRKKGLNRVGYDDELAKVAESHSRDMAERDFFAHMNPDGETPSDRAMTLGYEARRELQDNVIRTGISENIYMGYLMSGTNITTTNGVRQVKHKWLDEQAIAEAAVEGWMNSAGHRRNILDPDHIVEGIGIGLGPEFKIYITQNFF